MVPKKHFTRNNFYTFRLIYIHVLVHVFRLFFSPTVVFFVIEIFSCVKLFPSITNYIIVGNL